MNKQTDSLASIKRQAKTCPANIRWLNLRLPYTGITHVHDVPTNVFEKHLGFDPIHSVTVKTQ